MIVTKHALQLALLLLCIAWCSMLLKTNTQDQPCCEDATSACVQLLIPPAAKREDVSNKRVFLLQNDDLKAIEPFTKDREMRYKLYASSSRKAYLCIHLCGNVKRTL